jgi:hypothetical protein
VSGLQPKEEQVGGSAVEQREFQKASTSWIFETPSGV